MASNYSKFNYYEVNGTQIVQKTRTITKEIKTKKAYDNYLAELNNVITDCSKLIEDQKKEFQKLLDAFNDNYNKLSGRIGGMNVPVTETFVGKFSLSGEDMESKLINIRNLLQYNLIEDGEIASLTKDLQDFQALERAKATYVMYAQCYQSWKEVIKNVESEETNVCKEYPYFDDNNESIKPEHKRFVALVCESLSLGVTQQYINDIPSVVAGNLTKEIQSIANQITAKNDEIKNNDDDLDLAKKNCLNKNYFKLDFWKHICDQLNNPNITQDNALNLLKSKLSKFTSRQLDFSFDDFQNICSFASNVNSLSWTKADPFSNERKCLESVKKEYQVLLQSIRVNKDKDKRLKQDLALLEKSYRESWSKRMNNKCSLADYTNQLEAFNREKNICAFQTIVNKNIINQSGFQDMFKAFIDGKVNEIVEAAKQQIFNSYKQELENKKILAAKTHGGQTVLGRFENAKRILLEQCCKCVPSGSNFLPSNGLQLQDPKEPNALVLWNKLDNGLSDEEKWVQILRKFLNPTQDWILESFEKEKDRIVTLLHIKALKEFKQMKPDNLFVCIDTQKHFKDVTTGQEIGDFTQRQYKSLTDLYYQFITQNNSQIVQKFKDKLGVNMTPAMAAQLYELQCLCLDQNYAQAIQGNFQLPTGGFDAKSSLEDNFTNMLKSYLYDLKGLIRIPDDE